MIEIYHNLPRVLERLQKEFREDPDYEKIHYTLDAKDNPRLPVMNAVLAKAARRKVN